MKKVLSTVAALGLVAGLASTAGAVEFKMSGHYMVEGAYVSDAAGTGLDLTEPAGADNASDAYWLHTFEIKPTMKVNDKISMMANIRLADDTFWGNQANGDLQQNASNMGGDVSVWHLYMDYSSPIGKMRFGRVPGGAYGTAFRDADGRGDRVMLWPSFLADGPWSTLFYIQKNTDNFQVATGESDTDSDTYVARLYYKTDNLDSGIHYGYTNNMTNLTRADSKNELTAYGKYKMDNVFVNAELTHFFGEVDYDAAATLDPDYDSWAGMIQVGAKFDALTPSLMYFYSQGDDNSADDELNAASSSGTGDLFEPLYILTGRHTGMLNNDLFSGHTATLGNSGVHAVVAAADYAVSKELTLHGAIGWAKADEVSVANTLQDDEYGWEYNVGAAYKLLDNLTYEAHFGYLDTGDYFNGNTTVDTTNNIYLMTHSLTMTF
ncbi:MAG: hypothetical protein OEV89_01030 [Desulfobulbaceae bacterium]|nr:hypothetical protein [Desulfobulbaceae bacterium]HIJ89427.1 hypothetical protein [Deltaproteobacteria bacterium]